MDEHFEYRTGRTDPQKSSRGLIAVLLILVILLGGMVSALSIMNIRLFRRLNSSHASFAQGEAAKTKQDSLSLAGMALEETDPVYQQLHDLPRGLYVAQVEPGSQAEVLGIQPGDVLISLNENPVSTLAAAATLLDDKIHCELVLWRDGLELPVTVFQ